MTKHIFEATAVHPTNEGTYEADEVPVADNVLAHVVYDYDVHTSGEWQHGNTGPLRTYSDIRAPEAPRAVITNPRIKSMEAFYVGAGGMREIIPTVQMQQNAIEYFETELADRVSEQEGGRISRPSDYMESCVSPITLIKEAVADAKTNINQLQEKLNLAYSNTTDPEDKAVIANMRHYAADFLRTVRPFVESCGKVPAKKYESGYHQYNNAYLRFQTTIKNLAELLSY